MDICFLLFLVLPCLFTSVEGSAFLLPMSARKISYVKLKGTCVDDIKGLTALQTGFNLESWKSDPCTGLLPLYWIRCSSDPSPRVTALDLGGLGLTGSLPDFSSMKALTTIDFSSNKITGRVPSFIASFPNLTLLNLANNDFSGTLPPSLSALSSTPKLTIVTTGNQKMHVHGKSRDKTSLIAPAPTINLIAAAAAPTTTRMLEEVSPSGLPTPDEPTTTANSPSDLPTPDEPTTTANSPSDLPTQDEPATTSDLPKPDEPTTTEPTTTTPDTPTRPSSTKDTPTTPEESGGGSSSGSQLAKIIGGSFSAFTALSGIAGFFTIRHRKKKKKRVAASEAATVVTVTIEPGTKTTSQSRS